jgi:hypothetical protein
MKKIKAETLQKFTRFSIARPWMDRVIKQGDRAYATDGDVMISVPASLLNIKKFNEVDFDLEAVVKPPVRENWEKATNVFSALRALKVAPRFIIYENGVFNFSLFEKTIKFFDEIGCESVFFETFTTHQIYSGLKLYSENEQIIAMIMPFSLFAKEARERGASLTLIIGEGGEIILCKH